MFPELLTPGSPSLLSPQFSCPPTLLCLAPPALSPLAITGHGVGKTQHPAGPCSPSAPKTPAVTAPKMNWEHAREGGLLELPGCIPRTRRW